MRNIKTKKGKIITLLNPSEKCQKAALELKHNVKLTNNGKVKSKKPLTKIERAYRAGRLDQAHDSAKAYCYNNGLFSKAKLNDKKRTKYKARKKNELIYL